MTFDEIIHTIQHHKKSNHIINKDIAQVSGIHLNTVRRIVNGENCSLYNFIDTIEALGFELNITQKGGTEIDKCESCHIKARFGLWLQEMSSMQQNLLH